MFAIKNKSRRIALLGTLLICVFAFYYFRNKEPVYYLPENWDIKQFDRLFNDNYPVIYINSIDNSKIESFIEVYKNSVIIRFYKEGIFIREKIIEIRDNWFVLKSDHLMQVASYRHPLYYIPIKYPNPNDYPCKGSRMGVSIWESNQQFHGKFKVAVAGFEEIQLGDDLITTVKFRMTAERLHYTGDIVSDFKWQSINNSFCEWWSCEKGLVAFEMPDGKVYTRTNRVPNYPDPMKEINLCLQKGEDLKGLDDKKALEYLVKALDLSEFIRNKYSTYDAHLLIRWLAFDNHSSILTDILKVYERKYIYSENITFLHEFINVFKNLANSHPDEIKVFINTISEKDIKNESIRAMLKRIKEGPQSYSD